MKHVKKYFIWLTDMFSVVLIVTKATNEILLLLLCAKATFLYGLSSVMAEIDFILENYFTVVSHWCQTGRKKSLWCHIGVRQDKIFHCGVTLW